MCIFQSNEVRNSAWMEHEGLVRVVEVISNAGLDIEQIITDRHKQNAAWIRRNLPDTDNHFDIWHVSKSQLTCTSFNSYDALKYIDMPIAVLIWSNYGFKGLSSS